MRTLAELRAEAREHARQLEAVKFLTVQDLAGRWGVSDDVVRAIPRAALPYLTLGRSRFRRYAPDDVRDYEERAKRQDVPADTPADVQEAAS